MILICEIKDTSLIRRHYGEEGWFALKIRFIWRLFLWNDMSTVLTAQIQLFLRSNDHRRCVSLSPSLTWSLGECCCWAPSCCEAASGRRWNRCRPPARPDWPGGTVAALSSAAGWLECKAPGGRRCRRGAAAVVGAEGEMWTDRLDCWAALCGWKEEEGGTGETYIRVIGITGP